ncbi:MAG: 2-succinyl-5-enolpyruvyl-6-hydroxy-3-cyclohexene-1-carboxylic-acid synthase [Muribaculaceae bacterium]|nr:2-succinyl-5-enolpyruvyl-6-hydroxy-3-cyclohexene-1-carboxylic-acid synthase [Muribaculaceae bacterium]
MRDTANANCRELLDVLEAQGVRTIVASPGSRNTPVLIGASARDGFSTRMVNDERAAGFIALGIAMATQKPVALCCTSGTALYNYAPAVAEAYYQKIPLIVISADRPSQWIEQDDSQTLRQFEALSKIVKKSFDIPAEIGMTTPCRNKGYATEREWYVNRIANEAVLTATQAQPGPVHINIQFAEPLNETIDYRPSQPRTVSIIKSNNGLQIETLKEIWQYLATKRVMVVAGFMLPDDRLNRALMQFGKLRNVTILAETLSNLHLGDEAHMIDSVLAGMTDEDKENYRPDVVITIGGALVSRMIKEYLREYCGEHWTLGDTQLSIDCMQRLTTHIDITPALFFKGVANISRYMAKKGLKADHDYQRFWAELRKSSVRRNEAACASMPWSEYKALDMLFKKMPRGYNLFLSNGTSVRYGQLLIRRLPHACFSCRGVSGIDGTNATAAGIASSYDGTTLLITGDMSFSYYPEVLNPKNCTGDLRIVVVNNRGGGIFRFIRTTKDLEQREHYFCSDPELPVEGLARAYGRPYMKAADERTMHEALNFLWEMKNAVIEIEANPEISAEILDRVLRGPKA